MKLKSAIIVGMALIVGGCGEPASNTNLGEYTKDSRPNIQAKQIPFVLPAGEHSVYKEKKDFYEDVAPKPYSHPNKWVVYIASPGWTTGGTKIETRLSSDAASADIVKQFIDDNNLASEVKVAWLQYDRNPHDSFVESLDKVPGNFIPFFLKPHGPNVDYFIHSPASRYKATDVSMRYDMWLKPYLSFADKDGADYTTKDQYQTVNGFLDYKSSYWDNWSRHWFIVNPEGVVMDAYFSYIGNMHLYNPSAAISSLIYHLDLDPEKLITIKPTSYRFPSLYSEPYWEGIHNGFQNLLNDAQ